MYHKDYDAKKGDEHPADVQKGQSGHEVYLRKYCKLVKSKEEHEKLGPDWGLHPSEKVSAPAEKEAGEVEYLDDDFEVEEKPKKESKWSKK